MAMTFATMQALIAATPDVSAQIRIIVDFLRDNTAEAALDVVNAIPTTDPADDGVTIWSDEGVLKVSGASG